MKYFWNILISIDQLVNVLASPMLNFLTSSGAYRFGNPDETLSSVMGKNIEAGHCRGCRFLCRYVLHPIDRNHCRDSIERDEHEI
mgnify:CR=1 FL=1